MTRIAVWANQYQQPGSSQPDGRGHIEISCTLVQELAAAMAQGQGMKQNVKGEWIFQLDLSCWKGNGQNPNAPIISGVASTLAETQQRAAAAAARKAQQPAANGNGMWGGAPAQAPAPQQWQPPAGPQLPGEQFPPAAPAAPAARPQLPQVPASPPAPAPATGGWATPSGF